MNALEFERSSLIIENRFKKTEKIIKQKNSFPYYSRKKFNHTLIFLSALLCKNGYSCIILNPPPFSDLVGRLIRLLEFGDRMRSIRKCIFKAKGPKYFTTMIANSCAALNCKIQELNYLILSTHRLPFDAGEARKLRIEECRTNVERVSVSTIEKIGKECFHFMGNTLEIISSEQPLIKRYAGSESDYAFISWSNAIEVLLYDPQCDQSILSVILKTIQSAFPFVTKLEWKAFKGIKNESDDTSTLISYYQDLLESEQKVVEGVQNEKFLKKYCLNRIQSVPLRVIENELVHEIKETLFKMKMGEIKIFPFGIKTHALIVEVTCVQDSSNFAFKLFDWKIINTGLGIIDFHKTKKLNGKLYVNPVVYLKVRGFVLNYAFLGTLINYSWFQESISCFYKWHDHCFLDKSNKETKKIFDSGKWYLSQEFGTCAYSGLEAWISCQLPENDLKKLHYIITEESQKKLRKIVNLFQQDNCECPECEEKKSESIVQGIKILLHATEKHFFQINREQN